jgi:predicted dehydrogenase/aryl-alcohol dehydrogenase-like predicted oxidoreductase
MAAGKLKWGIMSTGNIAKTLAKAVNASTTGELVAVGSRSQASADKFGDEFNIPNRHATYQALVDDPKVDAIYIGLPNHMHAEWTIKCARAGKHILCEKPFATNIGEAMAAMAAVKESGVFFMEAFMYRTHPQTAKIVEIIKSGDIGEVRVIQAQFSYNMGPNYENIRMRNDASGGGIMDVGCYTMSMVRLIAGAANGTGIAEPLEITGHANIGSTSRVDEWATASVKFPGNVLAVLATGTQVGIDSTVRVWGSKGSLLIPVPWFPGEGDNKLILHKAGEKQPQEIIVKGPSSLYAIEVDTVAANIAKKQAPAPCMTWADTMGNQKALDQWRGAVGLTFDREKPEAMTTPVHGGTLAKRPDAFMTYHTIKGIDLPISRAVMGSMIYNNGELPMTFAMLDYFYEIGGNCIDMAFVYGGGQSEQAVGKWIQARGNRKNLVLLDKGAHPPHTHPDHVTPQIKVNLERVGVDCIDLWALHRDDVNIPVGEWIDVLNENVKAGRIKQFGGSNWTTARLEEANNWAKANGKQGFTFSSPNLSLARWNQPFWAGCVTASDAESRAWYEKHQFPLFSWSSQASGFFAGRITAETKHSTDWYQKGAYETWFNEGNFKRLERARELAKKKGVNSAQIGLAYVVNQPFPCFALMGPRTPDETLSSCLGVKVELTRDELEWLALED